MSIVIDFPVLWSTSLSSFLVHLKTGPVYLTSDTAQVFILSMRFLLQHLVLRSFLFCLRYSFFFFLSWLVCMCPLTMSLRTCYFLFPQVFWLFLYVAVVFFLLFFFFYFSLSSWHFLSKANSFHISYQFSFTPAIAEGLSLESEW